LAVGLGASARVDEEFVSYGSRPVGHMSPLVRVGSWSVELEVTLGDGAELGRIGDVVADLTPTLFVAGVKVEVGLDPVNGVAPHRLGGVTGGDRAEQLNLPGCWSVERGEDAFGPGPSEAGVDEGELAYEFGALGCVGVERPVTFALVGVEFPESADGAGLGVAGSFETVVGVVEVVGGGADGV
jgi:hypothetical protein